MVMEKSFVTQSPKGRALKELQGLKLTVVKGAAAATNIAVSGLGAKDTIAAVLELAGGGSGAFDAALVAGASAAANIPITGIKAADSLLDVFAIPYSARKQLPVTPGAITHGSNVAVTGIKAVDSLASVWLFHTASPNTLADKTSDAAITSDGNIQFTVTDVAAGDVVIVFWDPAALKPVDVASQATIPTDGNLQLSTLDTSKMFVVAIWSKAAGGAGAATDLTSSASIASAGNLQVAGTDTTGADLLVAWFQKPTDYAA